MRKLWDLYTPCLTKTRVKELEAKPREKALRDLSQPYNELRHVYELTAANSAIGEWARASKAGELTKNEALLGTTLKNLYDALQQDGAEGQPLGQGKWFQAFVVALKEDKEMGAGEATS